MAESKAKFRFRSPASLVWIGMGAGAFIWILGLIRHSVEANKGALFQRITIPVPSTFWVSFSVVCVLLLLYSAYAQYLVSRRRRAEKALLMLSNKLEKQVEKRTFELSKSNARLKEQINERKRVGEELRKEVNERKRVGEELRKVNRALKTLSECNKVIVHTDEEPALLNEICRIIVEVGGYYFVWVGFAEEDEKKSVCPMAHAGHEAGYLNTLNIKLEEDAAGNHNPVCEAIRMGSPCIVKNLQKEDEHADWRNEALQRGYASLISLPLSANGWTFGALNIFAQESDAFDVEEINLLKELAGELAFGIAAARTRDEQQEWEQEKEKLQAQLLQAQKMEAVGTLAGGVAHDFNNLLTAIQGYTEIALLDVEKAEPLSNNLEQIHCAAERATSLTRQLLLFSRRQPMEFAAIKVNRTIEGLSKMLKRLIGEDIVIKTDMEPDLWTIQADAGNIEQVFMNLALNARDAMPEGGILSIKTQNVTIDQEYCKVIPEARPGKFVCLSVADTGIGMDSAVLQRIFEPFFTTKEFGKGTGLGLSVVYGIVKQHEGWINVYSEPRQGSVFKVYLPSCSIELKDEAEEKISLEKIKGQGERILLVEDENAVREFTAKVLGDNGYKVFAASHAKEAVAIFQREQGKFHMIFSDIVLPDRNGLQLVDQLLKRNPKLLILLSSGYSDDKSQWPAIHEKGFRFLQKPYSIPDLLQAVKEVIEKTE
jgi:signal transduction histidine kinase/CheY-like chemotaxis protein